MGGGGYLGHRVAQPQAVLSVPAWGRAGSEVAGGELRRGLDGCDISVPVWDARVRGGALRRGLDGCDMRANGPESYQPGPTAQVSGLIDFRRAEGPSHRLGRKPPRGLGIHRESSELSCASCAPSGRLEWVGAGTWGIALLSPRLSSRSPLGDALDRRWPERNGARVFQPASCHAGCGFGWGRGVCGGGNPGLRGCGGGACGEGLLCCRS
jgi:hypothetical protein